MHRNRGRGFGNRNRGGNWRQGNNNSRNNQKNDESNENRDNETPNSRNDRRNDNGDQYNSNWNNQRRNHNGRPYNSDNRRENRYDGPRIMGFKMLQEMLKNDDLEDVIFILSNDKNGFKGLLENTKQSADITVLTVKLLHRICDCSFQNNKIFLLSLIVDSGFIQIITHFIASLAIQTNREKTFNKFFWDDPDDFWNNLISVSKTFNNLVPSTSCEVNIKLLKILKLNIPHIEETHSIHISDNIKAEINNLCDIVEKTSKEVERKAEEKKRGFIDDEDLKPPDDFRDINVYPNAIEITCREPIFLRRNIVKGPYQDVNQYLDIQYRLLREDFVLPLRNGICKYIENRKGKLDDIRIYNHVKFLNMENVTDLNCYRIQYDFSNKKRSFQYENSKMFMFGSLLCFTHDKFKSIIFAKVVQRDIKDLEKGQIIVGFNPDIITPENIYDLDYLMVESKVYFEPYYQVLNVLKHISVDNFPMERYIIQVNTDGRPPEYLLKVDPVYLTIEKKTFWPLDWGDKKFYGLNDAQSEAFQAALTKEFAIIQGPPGTGKTFLGLKIARTLLENKNIWYDNTPLLVICFTNHALDQFLEGLIPTTGNLIRVGGQSKNETINFFNLRNRKHKTQPNQAVIQKRFEVRDLIRDIASINEFLSEIEKYSSIVEFNIFSEVVKDFRDSWFGTANKDKVIAWLLEGGQNRINFRRNIAPPQRNDEAITVDDGNLLKKEDEENMGVDVNELMDDVFQDIEVTSFNCLTSIKILTEKISILKNLLDLNQQNDQLPPWERDNLEDKYLIELYNVENALETLKFRLEEGEQQRNNIRPPEYVDLKNPHNMPPDLRWQLYFYWLSLYENQLRQKKEIVSVQFRRVYSVYNEMREIEDTQLMKGALVIGMTTTGAARLQSSLQALKSPIVIVEEAAEVLEAHIISALTPYCQHLILIGDHQQLKPSTANFKIETQFLLGVSLFERMVANNIQCHTLNIQHRMRPEIANLVRPAIYPVLNDHETVFGRPHIMGVEHDLFFIDHNKKEQLCNDSSKKNVHEAKFLIQFARHLILNGYRPENIIILAAYLGQMFEMQRERRNQRHLLQDVRIAVLDNYQGEESDIVLLSLVRSNDENKIGFLSIENRVCVALSRARNGFYIMGNMKQLADNSAIWPQVRETLKHQNAIGPHLTLRCQIHPFRITNVSVAEDFLKLPEGGCDLLCESALNCGHICKRLCHIEDREHVTYDCQEKCEKLLCDNSRHTCLKFCYQPCGPCCYPVDRKLNCGHTVKIECHLDPTTYKCHIMVDTTLPCGHEAQKPCSVDPEMFRCPYPCDTRVEPCGHACTKTCHFKNDPDHLEYSCKKPCEKSRKGCTADEPHKCPLLCFQDCGECVISVRKERTKCGHLFNIACNANPELILCEKPCKNSLPCGHKCRKKCEENCGDCQVPVEKIVHGCDHKVKIKCCETPTKNVCKEKCPRLLACGHKCGKKCNEDCRTRCKEIVDCSIASPCGHVIKSISCYIKHNHNDEILLKNCSEKCNADLKCKHKCNGTCGECFQGRIHKRCQEKCGYPLVCNHECPIPCREACKPCKKPCEYRCKHSKCKRLCGDPCTPCREKCPRSCKHQQCTRNCGLVCNVDPCTEWCTKELKCGHNCVGFCGDPCPNLCRICNEEELTEIFFGTEDDEDARFVLLQDCGHVLESTGMESWLEQDETEVKEIKPLVCPKCKTVIRKTSRYSDYVKQSMEDLRKVKIRSHGNPKEIEDIKMKLNEELNILHTSARARANYILNEVIVNLLKRLENTKDKRKQHINKMDLDSIRMKIELLKMIVNSIKKENLPIFNHPMSSKHISFIASILVNNIDSVTQQETDDIMLEINRLNRWIQFESINLNRHLHLPDFKIKVEVITALLERPCRYSNDLDTDIKSNLETLKKLTSSTIALTDSEKMEIVRAVGLSTGHWYKCPNGHPYAIGEFGGAMQESRCYECHAKIGGTHHRLLPNNAVATEMDGARHGAWSEGANMNNYRL